MAIKTQFGTLKVARRFGAQGQYVETVSSEHRWFCLNSQKGWIPVPENGRALAYARGFHP